MPTAMTVLVNCDTQDLSYGTSGVDWVEVDVDNDKIIFSNGSDIVKDGEPIPSETELLYAGVVIDEDNPVIVPKYFLKDISEGIIDEIHNAGNQNKRYVFCFSFDGATTSEPRLELWDDSDLDTVALYSIGEATPTNSWWKGIVTTDGLPGADWIGSALAGDSTGHFLWLNNGGGASPLTVAKDLYVNLKIVVPAGAGESGSDSPVFAVKWTTN
jgi:hypothetical protein